MPHKRVRPWREVRSALIAAGIDVSNVGSEEKLTKRLADGTKVVHILQHKCCESPSAIVYAKHLSVIMRKFGLTDADFDS
jgi:hypothetical protein